MTNLILRNCRKLHIIIEYIESFMQLRLTTILPHNHHNFCIPVGLSDIKSLSDSGT